MRRFSQAISEGDGISLIVPVEDVESARVGEQQGAEGILIARRVPDLREGTTLPILWGGPESSPEAALGAGADACLLAVQAVGDGRRLVELHAEALGLGLECVLDVRDDEELELALEHVDPEIFLLSGRGAEADEEELERVLDLLPDVPAGKLAIAELSVRGREEVAALERAGIDAVIVASDSVLELLGGVPPGV